MDNEKRFAVLIDSENISSTYINIIFDEIPNISIDLFENVLLKFILLLLLEIQLIQI